MDRINFQQNEEVCAQHDDGKLAYFCLTCEKPICSDCAMIGKEVIS